MVNYPYFSLNDHILCFWKLYKLFTLQNNLQNLLKMSNILQFLKYEFSLKRLFPNFRIVFNNITSTIWTFFSSNFIFCTYLLQNSLMTTAHFIIWYFISVFSIFNGSSVIFVGAQTGIITTFKCKICLRLGSPILSTYSLNVEII